MRFIRAITLCFFALAFSGCAKQFEGSGQVIDSEGMPIRNAAVYTFSPEINHVYGGPDTWTDADGRFELSRTISVEPFRSSDVEIIVTHDNYSVGREVVESGLLTKKNIVIRLSKETTL